VSGGFGGLQYGPQPTINNELGRPIVIAGTGSPLGWINANANTIYRDNAVTGGIAFWYKADEIDTNGWVPLGSLICSNCLVTEQGQPLLYGNGNFILVP
jgi:hypothetical protein